MTGRLCPFILSAAGALVFSAAHPGLVFPDGAGFAGWLLYVPVLFAVRASGSFARSAAAGFLYGALSYGLYAFWLARFSPAAFTAVCLFCGATLAAVFVVLRFCGNRFGGAAWIIQWLVLCSYEYTKTLGFAGFGYGVTAYTQWRYTSLIGICDITGVFGLNMLVIFSSALLFRVSLPLISGHGFRRISPSLVVSASLWGILVAGALIYGKMSSGRFAGSQTVGVAAVQNNEDPWKSGAEVYRENIQRLISLTEEAVALNPDTAIVVWPETAVVPPVVFHYYSEGDARRHAIAAALLDYMDSRNQVFVIGNSHRVVSAGGDASNFNSALVFVPGENTVPPEPYIYSKTHLVPFTETFPFYDVFPPVRKMAERLDAHLWTPGKDTAVFSYAGLRFSTPICFEDTFTSVCRKMRLAGSGCFVNLSNDSWASSGACQRQHLSMAVFRSVENRVPSVRSTSSGVTCMIDPDGNVTEAAPPFTMSFVAGRVPVVSGSPGFYTRHGDYMGILCAAFVSVLLLIKLFAVIIARYVRSE